MQFDIKTIRVIMDLERKSFYSSQFFIARTVNNLKPKELRLMLNVSSKKVERIQSNLSDNTDLKELLDYSKYYNFDLLTLDKVSNKEMNQLLQVEDYYYILHRLYKYNVNQCRVYYVYKKERLTMEQVGRIMNVSRQAVYKFLKGSFDLSEDAILKLETFTK